MPTREEGGQGRSSRKTSDAEVVEETEDSTAEVAERQAKLTGDVDDLLDEIDDVLEENAEEFVRSYVQKGGQ